MTINYTQENALTSNVDVSEIIMRIVITTVWGILGCIIFHRFQPLVVVYCFFVYFALFIGNSAIYFLLKNTFVSYLFLYIQYVVSRPIIVYNYY